MKVYLPPVADAPGPVRRATPPLTLRGIETVLLAEDDAQVRAVVRDMLMRSGYHVLEAGNAAEALQRSEEYKSVIHLLLTDVVMPDVSGPELAVALRGKRPGIKVLFMSGYTENAALRNGLVDATLSYIQKPVTSDALGTKVREVLDALA